MGENHRADRPPVDLDEVVRTEELHRRPTCAPDHGAENRALLALADVIASPPRIILQKLADLVLEICQADSAGISMLEQEGAADHFRWHAVAGTFGPSLDGTVAREASPCGVVIDRNATLLLSQPGRYFPTVDFVRPRIVETLLVPFRVSGRPIGTVWAMTQTPGRGFDAEDARLLENLARFASASYQLRAVHDAAEESREALWRRVEERTRELTEANEAQRQGETLYRALAANLPNGAAFVVDRDLKYRLADGQSLRDAGRTPADLEGKALRDVLAPDLVDRYEANYRAALEGKPFVQEHSERGRYFSSHGVPLKNARGEIYAALAVSYDITDRKSAEERQRESEERFRLLVENVSDYAISFLDPEGRIVGWNEGAERLIGYKQEDVLGRFPDFFYTPEDRARGLPRHEQEEATDTGRSGDENWMVRADGTRFWASGSTTALRDASGGLRGFVKIFRDLTEQRASEAAVRESRERLRLALTAARMGIWTWDVATDTHTRDENLNRLLGLEPVETKQPLEHFLLLVHPDDRAAVAGGFSESVVRGRPLCLEFRVMLPDGGVRWLRDQGDIFNGHEGGMPHMAGACVDITHLKEVEEALRRARDELEDRVAARTAELARANDSLRAEVAERRRAEAARTELLRQLGTAQEDERRRVSRELHDGLGQELTALILGLKALEEAVPRDAPGRSRLREVEEVVGRIGREAHELAVELRPTALDDIGLGAAVAAYVARWSERTGVVADFQPLGLDGDRLPPELETTVYRVVQEALNNVAKHAGAGRVSVIVERRRGEVTALVEDDGRGFDPDRIGPGTGGRGLGLMGMRERVGLVGGALLVESEAGGGGTTVRASIPLTPSPGGANHGGS